MRVKRENRMPEDAEVQTNLPANSHSAVVQEISFLVVVIGGTEITRARYYGRRLRVWFKRRIEWPVRVVVMFCSRALVINFSLFTLPTVREQN